MCLQANRITSSKVIKQRSFIYFISFFIFFSLLNTADPAALGFIISPWSLLLLPSGSVSFTDENVSQQDLRAFTAPEVLQNHSLSSLSNVEKVEYLFVGRRLLSCAVDYLTKWL